MASYSNPSTSISFNLRNPRSENKYLAGVERPVEEIESELRTGYPDIYKLGIWGIGGIGKTTIADAVFNKISRNFEGSYFAHNVRDAEATDRIKDLQEELLSKLLNEGNIRNIESQLNRLARKKVLIVFDDVTHPRQIESLIGGLDQLASGSRVIITTRDKQVLDHCWVNQIYSMNELAHADALKLFCQYAFGGADPDASYTELAQKAIKYAHGLPLALKVLGGHLRGSSKEEWKSALRKLEIIPHMEIQKALKISYDSLNDSQKNVFLDIACLLEGEHTDEVISFLGACGYQAETELSVLQSKSLITVDRFNRISMHDLLRDMGREIVRKESIDNPGKRSRLWHHKDIYEVLKENKGTEAIMGLSLDMSKINEIYLNPDTFSKMPKLRFLKFYSSTNGENKCKVSNFLDEAFTELRYFHWHNYPLDKLPSGLHVENLVLLKLRDSEARKLWNAIKADLEWIFVVTNFVLELASAVFDQLSSARKPQYALLSMLVSVAALLICVVELIYTCQKQKVQWRWISTLPWLYHAHNRPFGNFKNITGLVCALCQCIFDAVAFGFACHHADSPIKVSLWPIMFASGLLLSKYLEK